MSAKGEILEVYYALVPATADNFVANNVANHHDVKPLDTNIYLMKDGKSFAAVFNVEMVAPAFDWKDLDYSLPK